MQDTNLRESPECQQKRHLRRNELMAEAGMLLSHLLSKKEKLRRPVWGPGWTVDCLIEVKGAS